MHFYGKLFKSVNEDGRMNEEEQRTQMAKR